MRGGFVTAASLSLGLAISGPSEAPAQPLATFSSGIDLVRVSAVVRDSKGRVVRGLTARDFEIVDAGEIRPISDFRTEESGISVAFLFDVSGSMEGQSHYAREAGHHLLGWLHPSTDESAVFMFDTQLDELTPFTSGLRRLPDRLAAVKPFGATSLHDAIARTAQQLDGREGRRRAVVVFTDGNDNASRLTPTQVSGIASAIDVPVYVIGIVSAIDDPSSTIGATSGKSVFEGPLFNLAVWTGGSVFVASSPGERSRVAQQVVEELRHQYLIAFESSGRAGWHPLEIRTRNRAFVVRARGGYVAGQSRPISE